MRIAVALTALAALAGCSGEGLFERRVGGFGSAPAPSGPVISTETPTSVGESISPPTTDFTAEETIGAGEVIEAGPIEAAPIDPAPATSAPAGSLGTTVASLGDATQDGFWLKTPLVSAPTRGRLVYDATGRSVEVDLLPLDGPTGGGSQISLSAMRLLGAPLTGLPELQVFLSS